MYIKYKAPFILMNGDKRGFFTWSRRNALLLYVEVLLVF